MDRRPLTENVTAFELLLREGGDLRSKGKSEDAVKMVQNQEQFDELFALLFCKERKVVMRAADAVEKISARRPDWLQKHGASVRELCRHAQNIELKWHLGQLVPRIAWMEEELPVLLELLYGWATDATESKIVRVNALQGMADMLPRAPWFRERFLELLVKVNEERVPSMMARIRKLREREA